MIHPRCVYCILKDCEVVTAALYFFFYTHFIAVFFFPPILRIMYATFFCLYIVPFYLFSLSFFLASFLFPFLSSFLFSFLSYLFTFFFLLTFFLPFSLLFFSLSHCLQAFRTIIFPYKSYILPWYPVQSRLSAF